MRHVEKRCLMILAKKPPTWFQGISGSKIRGASRVLVGIGLIVRGRIKCVLLKEARLHNLIDPASYLQGPLLLLPRLCNERVSEVALDIGFKSITNFNRTFKQLAGQSPSDYDWRFREHLNQTGIAVHVSYFYSRRGKHSDTVKSNRYHASSVPFNSPYSRANWTSSALVFAPSCQ